MKKSTPIWTAILLQSFFLTGCGSSIPSAATTATSGSPTNSSVGANSAIEINSGGSTVAYVTSFNSGTPGQLSVYIPSAEQYAVINETTGSYLNNAYFYYAATNCTGSPVSPAWLGGEPGKIVNFDGTSYWVLGASVTASFPFQSTKSSGTCTNSSSTVANVYAVTATTQPYNFAAIAPLTLTYP